MRGLKMGGLKKSGRCLKGALLLLVPLMMIGLTAPAQVGATIIDFSSGAAGGGSVIYDLTTLEGSNIPITFVGGIDTPQNAGQYPLTGGLLSFETGPLQSYANGVWTFGSDAGSYLRITGAFPAAGIIDTQTVLLGAYNVSAQINAGMGRLLFVAGQDTKNAQLLSFFGLPSTIEFSFDAHAFLSSLPDTNIAFSTTAYSVDVSNRSVPEPATLLLIGLGLTGLGLGRRAKKTKGERV